jgi:PilZ domain
METMLFISLLVGAGLAATGGLVFVGAAVARWREERSGSSAADRRQYTRVPCHFRTEGEPVDGPLYAGDLSLGGACVRLPAAAVQKRLKVVAVDDHGLAPDTTIEGRVVSMEREGALFVHHLAFEPGAANVTVAAMVAAATWGESPYAVGSTEHEVL